MRPRLTFALLIVLSLHAAVGAQATRKRPPRPLPCGDLVGFQVLLDRQGFSPGQIDGKPGANFSHALAALQSARGLPSSGQPDCATWQALAAGGSEPAITTYTVTSDDLKGPFEEQIPPSLAQQATLATLGYQSAMEELAERFHASPALLQQLNPGAAILEGREIRVPAVTPFNPDIKPTFDPAAADVTILVSRDDSALRATRADGTILFYAPVTTGSVHDPLPSGDYKVLGLSWLPAFHYNPTCSGTPRRATKRRRSKRDRTTRSASCGSRSTSNTTGCTARRSRATSATPSRTAACG